MTATLYSYFRSSCSWRVRIALNLKQISYNLKTLDITMAGGEHHLTDEFRAVNPMAQVPALQIDGRTIIDSLAIMYYLEETRPQFPLLPPEIIQRTKMREICSIICAGIQPLQNIGAVKYLKKEQRLPWAQRAITHGFTALEQILATSAGKYCVGDEITMADCCLVPQVYSAKFFKVDVDAYPCIVRIDKQLASHPAISASHPFNQPDCPENMKR